MKNFINQQESETLEFKESLSEREEGGQSLVAFANKNGGKICFGVKNNGEIKGIEEVSEKTIRDLAHFYGENTDPRLYPIIKDEEHHGKHIVLVEIEKSQTPYHVFRHHAYIRVGASDRQMTQEEYKNRFLEYGNTNFDFSAEICKGLLFNDLDAHALEILRTKWSEKEQKEEYSQFSLPQVLEKLLLSKNGEITFAALLLCGKPEKLSEFLPEAEIRFGWKNAPQKLDFDFTKDWRKPFLIALDEIWEAVQARNSRFPFAQGFFEEDIWAFDKKSIREAVLNAFAHRNYREKGSIFLEASPLSFIAESPGRFLPGVSPENALDVKGKWRNRLLMETLGKIGLVERYGHGLDRIFKESISKGKGTPKLEETKTGFVKIEIPAQVKDEKFIIFLQRIASEKQISFNLAKDLLFLDEIREHQASFDIESKQKFLQLGIIEKTGKGRGSKYSLSSKLYDFLGNSGEHTRKKWLSKEQQKTVLWNFFQDHKQGRMADFREEIFEGKLSNQQINILLGQLREDGKITFEGKQRSPKAYWRIKTS